MQKGFTVLELLVVIAIIGILSSIILVSYNGYTNKARLAKTLQWAGSINHSLGDRAVGAWTFDNITGTTVYDDSGNNNNGTAYGGPAVVDGVVGKALSFNGSYIDVNNFSVGSTITILAWFKNSNYDGRIPLSIDGSNYGSGPNLFFYANRISWNTGDGAGNPFGTVVYPDGNWHHFAIVVDATANNAKLYIDSKLAGVALYRNPVVTAGIFRTGNFHGGGYSFNGLIDDVRIYSAALSQAEIQQHYADGLKTHQPLAQQ